MNITVASDADIADWTTMRQALWPQTPLGEHASEISQLLQNPARARALIARDREGKSCGFAEASLRVDHVNGCETSPVAFLEGIYVEPGARRSGVAGALVSAVEDWALAMGCSELASDALLDNMTSHKMHNALGFVETQRVVYFRKVIG